MSATATTTATTTAVPSQTATPGANELLAQMVPIVAILLIMYWFIIRPQQKRIRAMEKSINELKKGDKVVVAGGILGEIVHVRENEFEVAVAPDTRLKVLKSGITQVVNKAAVPLKG